MERFRPFAGVYVLLVRNGKIYLLRRSNTGFRDGEYNVPGGHLDGNEPASAGAAREGLEEAGVTIAPEDLTIAHISHRKNPDREYVDIYFEAKRWTGEPHNAESDKSDHGDWFPFDNLPEPMMPFIRHSIQEWRKGNFYSQIKVEGPNVVNWQ